MYEYSSRKVLQMLSGICNPAAQSLGFEIPQSKKAQQNFIPLSLFGNSNYTCLFLSPLALSTLALSTLTLSLPAIPLSSL